MDGWKGTVEIMVDLEFYQDKKIFITGHTGFKGSWLAKILIEAGANVTGYSLEPITEPNLFSICNLQNSMESIIGDIRNLEHCNKVIQAVKPDIVFHLAAQPIVRESYKNPVYTYETNVMGTVNILECIRNCESVRSFLNVTTDKVYKNNEWQWGYREYEELNGFDPYSNSKSCSELVTQSYKNSFFQNMRVAISTARAGNVIGGGDFATDRIIPDCVRAANAGVPILVRNPNSIRPYQHVLEPLFAYLMIAEMQFSDASLADCYNVGPDEYDCVTTEQLVEKFCSCWNGATWKKKEDLGPHEASFLKLDCSKMKNKFGWKPCWNIDEAIEKTVEWSKCYLMGNNAPLFMESQIKEFYGRIKTK